MRSHPARLPTGCDSGGGPDRPAVVGPEVSTIGSVSANPAAIPADTSPEVWRQQMAAIARRSVAERLDEWAQLNRGVERMAEGAVRRRHPDYDDRQVFLALVRRRYGDDLALAVWPEAADVEP